MSWRDIDDNQPLTVTAEVVKDFLLRYGQDRMARWLDDQLQMPEQLSRRLKEQQSANDKLRERLYKYEPPAEIATARSYRAGPMSDG